MTNTHRNCSKLIQGAARHKSITTHSIYHKTNELLSIFLKRTYQKRAAPASIASKNHRLESVRLRRPLEKMRQNPQQRRVSKRKKLVSVIKITKTLSHTIFWLLIKNQKLKPRANLFHLSLPVPPAEAIQQEPKPTTIVT